MRMIVLLAAGLLIGTAPVDTAFDGFPIATEDSAAAVRIRIADGMAAAAPAAAEAERPAGTRF